MKTFLYTILILLSLSIIYTCFQGYYEYNSFTIIGGEINEIIEK